MTLLYFKEVHEKLKNAVRSYASLWIRSFNTDYAVSAEDVEQEMWAAIFELPDGFTESWYLDKAKESVSADMLSKRSVTTVGRKYVREVPTSPEIFENIFEFCIAFCDGRRPYHVLNQLSYADKNSRIEIDTIAKEKLSELEFRVWKMASSEVLATRDSEETVADIEPKTEAMKETAKKYPSIAGKKYHGFTQQDIADKMGVSREYIKKILKRIKDKLRSINGELQEEGVGSETLEYKGTPCT